MSKQTAPPPPEEMTFEQALRRLETIVEMLENDEADLDAALQAYEEGVRLARFCLQRLEAAELRIQELRLE
ncbi:exodeoxyribonuclease VII small subunit [Rhodocaloribacter litoris]|uniref:exodeoxyribonuclease VII small subunit n=1 Tax=Rhodocaloribacter litoris TaxID=2558931 RepID=UPI0014237FBE|nr:exodeoxyribonuclease VII small subunit [Rhodocaloribacter litoris]QXD14841.1 exodeoxyribonuclease VII small subunit [Rhodocaloribacter litoris]GIV59068.1 MAG: exodeoxyribonuclease 7 small subunit [Rhodothermaceae bacterium]